MYSVLQGWLICSLVLPVAFGHVGSLVNITAEYIDKKMFVTWAVPLKAHCREINTFIIKWNNIQKPKPCHGIKFIKVKWYFRYIYYYFRIVEYYNSGPIDLHVSYINTEQLCFMNAHLPVVQTLNWYVIIDSFLGSKNVGLRLQMHNNL